MENNETNKPPLWFWIVSIIALIWNVIGAIQYVLQAYMTDEQKALLPSEQLEFMNNTPAWVTGAFAIAVWSGVIASIGLLLKKKWSKTLFLVSLIAVILQFGYTLFIANAIEIMGIQAVIGPLVIFIIAILLLFLSNLAIKRGWLK